MVKLKQYWLYIALYSVDKKYKNLLLDEVVIEKLTLHSVIGAVH